ncbi:MAG: hypothetical protein RLZZ303_776 [Candidatus Hydrogenedentota bacterium]|jgi:hypothetical protein
MARGYIDGEIASTNGVYREQLLTPIAVADVASGAIIKVFDYPTYGASRFSPDGKSIVFEGYVGMVLPIDECAPEGEGDLEGNAEGEGGEEGAVEGEGTVEGFTDGEGTIEGSAEGANEGATEGDVEGSSEGGIEGDAEGSLEGNAEGDIEGTVEGGSEGSEEGAAEGESNAAAARITLLALPGLDFNQDGKLDESEYAGMQSGSPEDFDALDLNDDGALSRVELLRQISEARPLHNADSNGDGSLNLSELVRLIQFYNAGGYDCAVDPDETEDGYLPEDDSKLSSGCPAHAADYLDGDGVIDLSELLRLIQLYNLRGIVPCESGEDGFCASS